MDNKIKEAKNILKKYKQEHIVAVLDDLDTEKQKELIDQVLKIDFEELQELQGKIYEDLYVDLEELKPIHALNPDELSKESLDKYIKKGEEIIINNKFAVATMAGGQGTRLGHNLPKGTFKIDIGDGGKYLFQIIVETLERANKKYNIIIPWYIMTSKENYRQTVEFLKEKKYFGYSKHDVYIFIQDEVPLLDEKGKLLLGQENLIKEAANGNGGIFASMKKNGVICDIKKRGIEWVFIGSVDNVLLKLVDPLLIGLTLENKTEIGTRTVLKRTPDERVGVICRQNNKVKVIEYTELPKEIAEIRKENGELVFGESHIMCNLFSITAIEKASTKELQYHVAFKRANYMDENGNYIKPIKPNAYKFEKFIFDAFKLFGNISILRGKREEDFAPVKNISGEDSPDSAKKLYEDYWNKQSKVVL